MKPTVSELDGIRRHRPLRTSSCSIARVLHFRPTQPYPVVPMPWARGCPVAWGRMQMAGFSIEHGLVLLIATAIFGVPIWRIVARTAHGGNSQRGHVFAQRDVVARPRSRAGHPDECRSAREGRARGDHDGQATHGSDCPAEAPLNAIDGLPGSGGGIETLHVAWRFRLSAANAPSRLLTRHFEPPGSLVRRKLGVVTPRHKAHRQTRLHSRRHGLPPCQRHRS